MRDDSHALRTMTHRSHISRFGSAVVIIAETPHTAIVRAGAYVSQGYERLKIVSIFKRAAAWEITFAISACVPHIERITRVHLLRSSRLTLNSSALVVVLPMINCQFRNTVNRLIPTRCITNCHGFRAGDLGL